jgi:hypothetical protein
MVVGRTTYKKARAALLRSRFFEQRELLTGPAPHARCTHRYGRGAVLRESTLGIAAAVTLRSRSCRCTVCGWTRSMHVGSINSDGRCITTTGDTQCSRWPKGDACGRPSAPSVVVFSFDAAAWSADSLPPARGAGSVFVLCRTRPGTHRPYGTVCPASSLSLC